MNGLTAFCTATYQPSTTWHKTEASDSHHVCKKGQSTLRLPSSGLTAEQRETNSSVCADWFMYNFLLMQKLPQTGYLQCHLSTSSTELALSQVLSWEWGEAAAGGLVPPSLHNSRVMQWGEPQEIARFWHMDTLPQHSKCLHIHWIMVTICSHVISLQKVLCCST